MEERDLYQPADRTKDTDASGDAAIWDSDIGEPNAGELPKVEEPPIDEGGS